MSCYDSVIKINLHGTVTEIGSAATAPPSTVHVLLVIELPIAEKQLIDATPLTALELQLTSTIIL